MAEKDLLNTVLDANLAEVPVVKALVDSPIGRGLDAVGLDPGNLTLRRGLEGAKDYLPTPEALGLRTVETLTPDTEGADLDAGPKPDFDWTQLTGIQPGLTLRNPKGEKGGGRGPALGSINVSAKGQAPFPVMAQAMMAKEQLKNDIGLQLSARATGLGFVANVNRDLAGAIQKNAAQTYEEVDRIFGQAERALSGVQELIDAARSNRINPGQFFTNVGDAGTFTASIAMAAGHLASALGGGPDTAYQVIKGAIDRNVRAQEFNQAHDRAMIAHQTAFVDRLQSLGINKANAANVHRAALTAAAQAAISSIAAQTASLETRAMIRQLDSRFAVDVAQSMVKAYEDITATATIKYYSMAGADAAARTVAGAARSAVGAQTGQLGGPRPVQPGGGGQAAGAGQAAGGGGQGAGGGQAAGAGGGMGQGGAVPTQGWQGDPNDFRGQAKAAAKNYQLAGGKMTVEALDKYISQFDPRVQSEMYKLKEEAYRGITDSDQYTEFVRYGEQEPLKLVKKARLIDLEEKKRDKAEKVKDEAQTAITIRGMHQQLDDLLKEITAGGRFLSVGGGSPQLNPFTSEEMAGKLQKMKLLIMNIANEERTKLGSDAIRSVSEWDIWKEIQGVDVLESKVEAFVNTFRNMTPTQQSNWMRSKFRPALERHNERVRTAVLPYYYTGDPADE